MSRISSAGATALALLSICAPAAAQDAQSLAGVQERVAPSIVNVRVVLKVEVTAMGQVVQNKEERSHTTGVVVDASGLILIANSSISADRVNKMLAASGREGIDVSITPVDLKVIFEGGETEHKAFLAASDRDLDLAFIQLEEPAKAKLAPVAFEDGEQSLQIGQPLVQVSRLSEGFDYAPVFASGRVAGKIKKPRKAFAIDGDLGVAGLPVYDLSGRAVGVLTNLESGLAGEAEGGMLGMGGMSGGQPFVIPSNVVRGVVQQAVARAKEVAAERAKGGGDGQAAPAEGGDEGEGK